MSESLSPWNDLRLPETVTRVPAQLAHEERRYLTWLTESAYTGEGRVVELGTLLGGSSCAFAEGLRRSGKTQPILAMDLFEWYGGDEFRPEGVVDGDDFMAHYKANVSEYEELIDVRRVDLTQATYDEGPIEFLFVDAAKSWGLLNSILRAFGPHLIPGRSRVIFQDFRFLAYWVELVIDSAGELWKQVEQTEAGCTVTFTPSSQKTLEWCETANYSDQDFPWSVAKPLFERRIESSEPANADRYRYAAMVKAVLEFEFDAITRFGSEIAVVERRGIAMPRAARRGSNMLQRRMRTDLQEGRSGAVADALGKIESALPTLPPEFQQCLRDVHQAVQAESK